MFLHLHLIQKQRQILRRLMNMFLKSDILLFCSPIIILFVQFLATIQWKSKHFGKLTWMNQHFCHWRSWIIHLKMYSGYISKADHYWSILDNSLRKKKTNALFPAHCNFGYLFMGWCILLHWQFSVSVTSSKMGGVL